MDSERGHGFTNVVSMKNMNENQGLVRPENGFYEKLNALKFVPQQNCPEIGAYWLPANEICYSNCLCEDLRSACDREHTKVLELEAEVLKQQKMVIESEKLKKTSSRERDTIRNLDAPDQHSRRVLILDGLKVENVSLKRKYDELSKANTHSRIAYTDKLSALTAGNNQLKAQVTGKTSSEPSTSETPKVLAPGMYNLGSKYIPQKKPKRANWDKPTPLPKKKQVPFVEPPRPSLKPTQKPVVHPNKQTNVCVPMSTGVNPTSGASKTVPKRAPRNHSSLPAKSANARRVEAHHRTLNKKNRVDSNLLG
ncbi:hypothetical protein Tco_0656167 [Tanacetum coccineum]|uniref:Uncharacterized protein n=1 Tax=Tanacetum coccineum TaxID=301880 RepID=A0ABQ4X8I5_9ASTR